MNIDNNNFLKGCFKQPSITSGVLDNIATPDADMDEENGTKKTKLTHHLNLIYKDLKREYPPHHYAHLPVWGKYWDFVELLGLKDEVGK